MSHIAFDFETFYSSKVSIRRMIAEEYGNHPECDVYMLSVYDGTTAWAGHPRNFNWEAFKDEVLVAHNAYFDWNIWRAMARKGLAPEPNFAQLHCTSNLTRYICNQSALDKSVELLYKIKLSKDVRSDAKGKRWPEDFSEEEQKAMLEYAKDDSIWCWKLFEDFGPKWPEIEKELGRITIEQGTHGAQLDTELLDNYTVTAHEMLVNTEKTIPWIKDADDDAWEEFNTKPTSTKCIAEQCRRSGIPCCPVKRESIEAYEAWEATYAPNHPWILAVTQWRSINKLYKSFQTMRQRVRDDGTMPFGLRYHGAHTGRWTAESQINMQNQRRRPVLCTTNGLMETNPVKLAEAYDIFDDSGKWPGWVKADLDFRSLIIPRPGKKLIVSDLSQIEPRVLAWLSGDQKMLDYFRSGLSAYEAHALATMGWDGKGKLKDIDSGMYSLAKARVLGLGYGCGWERFISMALTMAGLDITKDDPEFVQEMNPVTGEVKEVSGYGYNSRRIVKDFRATNPKIVEFWKKLDGGLKSSISSDFEMDLPSGRSIRYRNVACSVTMVADKETGEPRRKEVWTAETDCRRGYYGAKLAENAVQAVSRDVFGEQIVRLDHHGVPCLFTVHDEGVFEVDKSVDVRDIQVEMSRCPEWLPGCPIDAATEEVTRYKK